MTKEIKRVERQRNETKLLKMKFFIFLLFLGVALAGNNRTFNDIELEFLKQKIATLCVAPGCVQTLINQGNWLELSIMSATYVPVISTIGSQIVPRDQVDHISRDVWGLSADIVNKFHAIAFGGDTTFITFNFEYSNGIGVTDQYVCGAQYNPSTNNVDMAYIHVLTIIKCNLYSPGMCGLCGYFCCNSQNNNPTQIELMKQTMSYFGYVYAYGNIPN